MPSPKESRSSMIAIEKGRKDVESILFHKYDYKNLKWNWKSKNKNLIK
jgi:hypothetical protein